MFKVEIEHNSQNSIVFDDYKEAINYAKHSQITNPNSEINVIRERDNHICWKSTDSPHLKKYEEIDTDTWLARKSNMSEQQIEGQFTYTNTPSIYFDIDGTLGKWYSDGRGMAYPDEILNPNNHYFRTIEPHPFIIELAKNLHEQGRDVCVISSADKDTIRDKFEWLQEHCPFIKEENIFFCPLGADKSDFIKGNADISILIDDYSVNLETWKGTPVKAINSINSVDETLICINGHEAETTPSLYQATMDKAISTITDIIETEQGREEAMEKPIDIKQYDTKDIEIANKISDFYTNFTDEPEPPTVEYILSEIQKDGKVHTISEYIGDIEDWLNSFEGELSEAEIEKAISLKHELENELTPIIPYDYKLPEGSHLIWSSDMIYDEEVKKDIVEFLKEFREDGFEPPDDEVKDSIYEYSQQCLQDERDNLSITLDEDIVIIADIGRWNGRASGYAVTEGNISNCLESEYNATWYVDKYGDLKANAYHHDGINHYLYRQFKGGITDEQKEDFLDKIYDGSVTQTDIDKYSVRLGDEIAKVYGYEYTEDRNIEQHKNVDLSNLMSEYKQSQIHNVTEKSEPKKAQRSNTKQSRGDEH